MSRDLVDPYIGGLARKVWQWVRAQIHAGAIAAGYDDLSPAQINLFRNPGIDGWRPSDVADDMQITKQSVNELLGHLERRGYLERIPDPTDNRSRRIRLTERGHALEATVRRASAQAERDAARLIGASRMRELRAALVDLVGLLEADPDAGGQKRQRVAP